MSANGDRVLDAAVDARSWDRRYLFGIAIDSLTLAETVAQIRQWMFDGQSRACRYVVTPNVDHIVKLQSDSQFLEAYRAADLVLADGWPLVKVSKLLRRQLPERVAGSDVVPALLESAAAGPPLKVFLLGGKAGVGQKAADAILKRWDNIEVVGVHSPPVGFESHDGENRRTIDAINACDPHLLVVAMNAPRQEKWLHSNYNSLSAKVAIAAGATIDFLAGEQKRAPKWVQAVGGEWLYRAASDPRRLAGRYMHDCVEFPMIVARELLSRSQP